ncbi:hypothetical protein N9R79_11040 [Vibrio sp.]|nr:hypothetical protein [Vibrio sp.]
MKTLTMAISSIILGATLIGTVASASNHGTVSFDEINKEVTLNIATNSNSKSNYLIKDYHVNNINKDNVINAENVMLSDNKLQGNTTDTYIAQIATYIEANKKLNDYQFDMVTSVNFNDGTRSADYLKIFLLDSQHKPVIAQYYLNGKYKNKVEVQLDTGWVFMNKETFMDVYGEYTLDRQSHGELNNVNFIWHSSEDRYAQAGEFVIHHYNISSHRSALESGETLLAKR